MIVSFHLFQHFAALVTESVGTGNCSSIYDIPGLITGVSISLENVMYIIIPAQSSQTYLLLLPHRENFERVKKNFKTKNV